MEEDWGGLRVVVNARTSSPAWRQPIKNWIFAATRSRRMEGPKESNERAPKIPRGLGLLDGQPLAPVLESQLYVCRTLDTLHQREMGLRATW